MLQVFWPFSEHQRHGNQDNHPSHWGESMINDCGLPLLDIIFNVLISSLLSQSSFQYFLLFVKFKCNSLLWLVAFICLLFICLEVSKDIGGNIFSTASFWPKTTMVHLNYEHNKQSIDTEFVSVNSFSVELSTIWINSWVSLQYLPPVRT